MCFSLYWFVTLLVWLVVVFGVVLPIVLGWLGVAGGVVMQVLNIILIMVVIIALIWFAYDLLSCAGGFGIRR